MYLGILEHIVLRSADVKTILTILIFMEAIPLCLQLNKPHLRAPFIYQLNAHSYLAQTLNELLQHVSVHVYYLQGEHNAIF
jgi:hypothetical protein